MSQMKVVSSYVCLRNVRLHGFHGVLPQERTVGTDFVIDLRVGYPLAAAMESDRLEDTVSYAALYELVRAEMRQPSNLLEHVAGRIVAAIGDRYPQVTSIDLTLTKKNPPMGADCEGAGVELHFVNEQ